MILHSKMVCFSNYRVLLNGNDITRNVYLADVERGFVLTRVPGPQGQGYLYEEITGNVSLQFAQQIGKG